MESGEGVERLEVPTTKFFRLKFGNKLALFPVRSNEPHSKIFARAKSFAQIPQAEIVELEYIFGGDKYTLQQNAEDGYGWDAIFRTLDGSTLFTVIDSQLTARRGEDEKRERKTTRQEPRSDKEFWTTLLMLAKLVSKSDDSKKTRGLAGQWTQECADYFEGQIQSGSLVKELIESRYLSLRAFGSQFFVTNACKVKCPCCLQFLTSARTTGFASALMLHWGELPLRAV
jgi:hypothetical protein